MEKESSLDKIVSSIALLCVGICFIVWADQVTEWIAIIFGAIAIFYSLAKFIKFFKTTPEKRTILSLFYIILSAATGVLLVSRAGFIKEAISFVIGIYIILTCSAQLLKISTLRYKTGLKLGSYLWPAIGVFIGMLCISGQFIIPNELARLTGAALVIYAIVYLTGFAVLKTEKKQNKKTEHLQIEEAIIVKEAGAEDDKPKTEKKSKK